MRRNSVRFSALYVVIFLFSFFLSPNAICKVQAASSSDEVSLSAKGSILIEQQSGKVLYEKIAADRLYPASTTKVLTALIALENGNLEDTITVGREVLMVPWDSSKAYLKEGEEITLRELLMGLMLPSGNDAAATIGVYIGRKASNDMSLDEEKAMEKFLELMNEGAKKAGATDSNFVNPHGYHDKNHYTTAHDLAFIAREAMNNEFFREMVSTYKYSAEDKYVYKDGQVLESVDHIWRNSNVLIDQNNKNHYEHATGIKTGYTSPAGHCLVSSASKDGLDLIAVTLGSLSQSRWEDPVKLLDYGFDNFGYYEGTEKDEAIYTLKVENPSSGSSDNLTAVSGEGFADVFDKEDAMRIEKSIVWDENLISPTIDGDDKIELLSSIETDQVIGKLAFILDGDVLKEIDLKAMEGVEKQGIMGAVTETLNISNILWFFAGMICGAVGILILLRKAAIKRRRINEYKYRNYYN